MSQEPAVGLAVLLRRLRAEAGLTQDELAAASGVSTRTISDLERAVNLTARKDTAGLLADALRLTGQERERFVAVARGKPAAGESGSRAETAASNVVWIESAASRTFVSRERELGVLREAWSSATAGHRVLALVAGEPGIGKTALTAELAREVYADGGLVLYGRWDEHVPAPYQAFREALTDYARACPETVLRQDLVDLAGEIARLYPVPAQRVGVSATPSLAAAEAERFRLFESLDTWIGRMAARHPVLLVLDDLQWADQSSLLLLPHLMRARRSTPLLTVAMYRDTGLELSGFSAALPSLTRDIDCRRLTLRGLEHDAVTALLQTVLLAEAPDRPLADRESAMVAELERETAGNPFFLLEMARHLAEGGVFDAEQVAVGQAQTGIPESVRDMVRSRLQRLSAECAEMLAIAALIGERFDAALLASAASLDDTVIIALLEEAERAGLIAEIDEDTDGEPDYWRFTHSLTRRVTAEELSRSRRSRLHHRIGETLESRPDTPPAQLAHHFGAAAKGAAEKAVGYERLAGERALREVAAEVAVRHFRRALQLLDRFGPDDQMLRCEVLLQLAGAHDRAGEYASRDERFAQAADAARRLESDDLFLRAALGYGGTLPATVDPDPTAQALLEEALTRSGEQDSGARATASARLAHWLHTARPYPERRELSDRAVTMARGTSDPRTLATVLLHRYFALDGPDDVDDALKMAIEIGGIGDELGDPELTLEGLRIKLMAQFENGAHAAAVATAREMKRLAERVRHPEFIRLAAMWDVTIASLEGRFADAEKLAAELDRRLQQIGHPQAQIIPVAQTFSRRWLQGQAAEYIPVFEALSASDPANHAWSATTAWCLAEAGARNRVADLLRELGPASAAEADKNYMWWSVIVGLSNAVDLVGDRQWAQALYDLAAPYAGNNCTLGVATFLGATDHWLGVLAGTAGRFTEAIAHLDAALARHQDMGARPWTALTQEAYGNVLSMRGRAADSERAGALRESAMRTAGELGLGALTRRPGLRG
jgi:transcriptional regulator with XRE-family HTH domain/tetratricopeptide (TPR) repeat protein